MDISSEVCPVAEELNVKDPVLPAVEISSPLSFTMSDIVDDYSN